MQCLGVCRQGDGGIELTFLVCIAGEEGLNALVDILNILIAFVDNGVLAIDAEEDRPIDLKL